MGASRDNMNGSGTERKYNGKELIEKLK